METTIKTIRLTLCPVSPKLIARFFLALSVGTLSVAVLASPKRRFLLERTVRRRRIRLRGGFGQSQDLGGGWMNGISRFDPAAISWAK